MREWVEQELGVAPWVFEGVFPPLLALLLVFLVRELVLLLLASKVADREQRKAWRRRTFWFALPLAILSAVGASWLRQRHIAKTLAERFGEVVEVQTYLGSVTKIVAYTLLLLTFILIIQRAYRALAARIDDWKPAEEGVKVQSAVLLSPERVRVMLTKATGSRSRVRASRAVLRWHSASASVGVNGGVPAGRLQR